MNVKKSEVCGLMLRIDHYRKFNQNEQINGMPPATECKHMLKKIMFETEPLESEPK